jgi:transcriptional regulator with XRE-family HTH domain
VASVKELTFGERLDVLRKRRRMNQRDFAKLLGVDYSAVAHWATGSHRSPREPGVIAEKLGMTVGEVYSFKLTPVERAEVRKRRAEFAEKRRDA